MAKYRYHALAALSGLLLSLAYPGWDFNSIWIIKGGLGWIAWIGLIPLFFALKHFTANPTRTKSTLKTNFKIGFFAGLIYFLIIFRWFWSIHPLNTLGIENSFLSLLIVIFIWILSSGGMAVFWGLFSLIFAFQFSILKKNSSILNTCYLLLATPALFVLLEYLRSWGFGFLWAGSGSLFGPHWTVGNLSYALADNSVIRWLASYVGIYGITFLIILVNLMLAKLIYGSRISLKLRIIVISLILIAISVIGYLNFNSTSTASKNLTYAIIQTSQQTKLNPNPQETLAGFKEQLELLDRVAKEHSASQIILFPEASNFFQNISLFLTPSQIQNYFYKLFKEPRLVISGGRALDTDADDKAYSRVFSLDTQGDIIGFYDKRLLTPGGEFIPYSLKILVNLFSKNTSSLFNQARDLSPGQKETSTIDFRYQFNIAPIICSEAIAPKLIKKIIQSSDVVASMASYGVFHGNPTIANQMLAITRFRAAENHKPVITATNMGRSSVIDSAGKIVFLATNNNSQILTGSVDIHQQKSWYNKVGDWPIILASLLLIIISISLIWFKETRRP
ncbi:MAG: apolipoprotein N-acyltransferase [Patescibacteria group bacterium]